MTANTTLAPCPTEPDTKEFTALGQFLMSCSDVRMDGGKMIEAMAYLVARAQAPAPHELPSKVAHAHFDQKALTALVQQLLDALETPDYEGRAERHHAREAAREWLGITGAPNA